MLFKQDVYAARIITLGDGFVTVTSREENIVNIFSKGTPF